MYLIPEDGQYYWNMKRVLTRIIKFVVVDGIWLQILKKRFSLALGLKSITKVREI